MCVVSLSLNSSVPLYSLSEVSASDPEGFSGQQNKTPSSLSLTGAEHSQHSSRLWPESASRRMVGKDWKEQVEFFGKSVCGCPCVCVHACM